MLYSVEKIPLVRRGLQGYIMARYGAGPGTQLSQFLDAAMLSTVLHPG